jgi:hypothetical protein
MDDTSTTTADLDQAEEDIFTYDVSDEALEAAADTERGCNVFCFSGRSFGNWSPAAPARDYCKPLIIQERIAWKASLPAVPGKTRRTE